MDMDCSRNLLELPRLILCIVNEVFLNLVVISVFCNLLLFLMKLKLYLLALLDLL